MAGHLTLATDAYLARPFGSPSTPVLRCYRRPVSTSDQPTSLALGPPAGGHSETAFEGPCDGI